MYPDRRGALAESLLRSDNRFQDGGMVRFVTARIGGRERVTLKRDRAAVVAVNREALRAGGKLSGRRC